jgi:hypothetical protein
MTDADGHMGSYCDCAKGRTVTTLCVHLQLVDAYADGFRGALNDGEEPKSFLICVENRTIMFSVASSSGSARHHSHKRTIVSKNDHWNCRSCVKDRFHSLFMSTEF